MDPTLDRSLLARPQSRHQQDVDRRMLERGMMFNADMSRQGRKTTNQLSDPRLGPQSRQSGSVYAAPGGNPTSHGEITGQAWDLGNEDQGLPMRDLSYYQQDRQTTGHLQEMTNPHLDFDLYQKAPQTENVSYFDPYGNSQDAPEKFSSVQAPIPSILQDEPTPSDQSYDQVAQRLYEYYQQLPSHGNLINYWLVYLVAFLLYLGAGNKSLGSLHRFLNFPNLSPQQLYTQTAHQLLPTLKNLPGAVWNTLCLVPNYRKLNPAFVPVLKTFASVDQYDPRQGERESGRISQLLKQLTQGQIAEKINPRVLSEGQVIFHTSCVWTIPWRYSFNSDLTQERNFYSSPPKRVPMMTLVGKKIWMAEDNHHQMLELPLVDPEYRFGLILHKQRKNPSPSWSQLQTFWPNLQEVEVTELVMPVFHRVGRVSVQEGLNRLGLPLQGLDLGNLTTSSELISVSRVYQTVIVRAMESGEEPCSKYDVPVGDTYRNPSLVADSPFQYYLRRRSDSRMVLSGMYV